MSNEAFEKGLPVGIAIGISIGVALGAAVGNMAFIGAGLAIGIGLAPVFGKSQLNKDNQQDKMEEDSASER